MIFRTVQELLARLFYNLGFETKYFSYVLGITYYEVYYTRRTSKVGEEEV